MFYIQLLPRQDDDAALLVLEAHGDVLTINGVDLDFSPLKNGDVLSAAAVGHDSVFGYVRRIGEDIQLDVLMPHRSDAPEWVRYPDPVIIKDGKAKIPTDAPEVTND